MFCVCFVFVCGCGFGVVCMYVKVYVGGVVGGEMHLRILAWNFDVAAPPWLTSEVDDGRPEG